MYWSYGRRAWVWAPGISAARLADLALTVEVVVPDTDKGKNNRQVLLKLGRRKVLVHLVGTVEQLLEVLETDGKGDRQTNGGPKGVSASNPVPELEHVGLVDTESGDGFGVGGKGDEVLGNVRLLLVSEAQVMFAVDLPRWRSARTSP